MVQVDTGLQPETWDDGRGERRAEQMQSSRESQRPEERGRRIVSTTLIQNGTIVNADATREGGSADRWRGDQGSARRDSGERGGQSGGCDWAAGAAGRD